MKTYDHYNRVPEASDNLRNLSNKANIVNRIDEENNKDSGYENPNSVSMIDKDASVINKRILMKR